MLPALNRLQKKSDIEHVFKRGRSLYMGNLGLRLAANKKDKSRFTVVVSLKVSKRAVKRNKLKRRLREIIGREILPKIKPGFDGVVLTSPQLLDAKFEELQKTVLALFKKAGLI